MPLYYFHVVRADGLVEDQEGVELPDVAASYSEAVRSAVEYLTEVSKHNPMQLEVTDPVVAIVFSASIHNLAEGCYLLRSSNDLHSLR